MRTTIPDRAAPPGRQGVDSTILVVEDHTATQKLLVSILAKEGYRTISADNGLQAMEVLQTQGESVDTILLDRMMPEMDGMEVIRRVLAAPDLKYIPIIMQTAADRPEEISQGIKAGVFYYLTKPIERKTLLSIVGAAIDEMKQRRALKAEMRKHRLSFGLIDMLEGSCRTLDEAESISSFLANFFPDPERALTGISELLFNAVEHGNLDISYDEKTALINTNSWRSEVERRLQLPEYRARKVSILFEKRDGSYYLRVTDQGKGFNWKRYLELDPSRASHNHGRGIAMANIIAFDHLLYNTAGNQVTAVMKRTSGP